MTSSRVAGMLLIALLVLTIGLSIYAYPLLPDVVASHWNARGEVDGSMSKFGSLLFAPIAMLCVIGLWAIVPRIDPLKSNITAFRPWFDGFIILLQCFFFYIALLTILYNTGTTINITQFMAPALALLFGYMGLLLPRTKRNWFIGIRTPWTLSSDRVWEKTHRLGGFLFLISACITLIAFFIPVYTVWLMIAPIIASALITVVYSYIAFKND